MLEQPLQLSHLTLRNRIVMPPMASAKANEDGSVSEALCEYYTQRAQGGHIALIITEHGYVRNDGQASPHQLSFASDEMINGTRELVNRIHECHTPVFAQLNHAGSLANPQSSKTLRLVCSGNQHLDDQRKVKVMDEKDIQDVISAFVDAALRAKEAGFDGIEIHSAHGYLLNQFYSPLTNHRQDAYNGTTIDGRIKFHLELIAALRKALKDSYPIALRLGACDYMEHGTTIADSIQACIAFEQAGIDLLDLSGGLCGSRPKGKETPGFFLELAQAIRPHVHIPVLICGGIKDPFFADQILKHQDADLIGIGRAMLQDPRWAQTALSTLAQKNENKGEK